MLKVDFPNSNPLRLELVEDLNPGRLLLLLVDFLQELTLSQSQVEVTVSFSSRCRRILDHLFLLGSESREDLCQQKVPEM